MSRVFGDGVQELEVGEILGESFLVLTISLPLHVLSTWKPQAFDVGVVMARGPDVPELGKSDLPLVGDAVEVDEDDTSEALGHVYIIHLPVELWVVLLSSRNQFVLPKLLDLSSETVDVSQRLG